MKKFLIQTILLIILISGGLYFYISNTGSIKVNVPSQSLVVNGTTLKVEIADEESERNKGLSGRESLGTDSGMLFVYDKPGNHTFWMKGMKFALDFIWIRGDIVTEVTENVPPPAANTSDGNLSLYSAKNNVDKILEVNAGVVKKLNIKEGDKIILNHD